MGVLPFLPIQLLRLKVFNDSKGFGFIKDANSAKEYFVHLEIKGSHL
jgi:hypothetical protein